jgi:hypothetical protein
MSWEGVRMQIPGPVTASTMRRGRATARVRVRVRRRVGSIMRTGTGTRAAAGRRGVEVAAHRGAVWRGSGRAGAGCQAVVEEWELGLGPPGGVGVGWVPRVRWYPVVVVGVVAVGVAVGVAVVVAAVVVVVVEVVPRFASPCSGLPAAPWLSTLAARRWWVSRLCAACL